MGNTAVHSEYKRKYRKPSITLLICFAIASLIWIFGYFSKDYTVKLNYTVTCSGLPLQKENTRLSDSVMTLVFNTSGFNFLNSKYAPKNRTINLPVYHLIQYKKQNRYNYIFTKNELNQYLKSIGFYENEFVEIESPENLTIYLK